MHTHLRWSVPACTDRGRGRRGWLIPKGGEAALASEAVGVRLSGWSQPRWSIAQQLRLCWPRPRRVRGTAPPSTVATVLAQGLLCPGHPPWGGLDAPPPVATTVPTPTSAMATTPGRRLRLPAVTQLRGEAAAAKRAFGGVEVHCRPVVHRKRHDVCVGRRCCGGGLPAYRLPCPCWAHPTGTAAGQVWTVGGPRTVADGYRSAVPGLAPVVAQLGREEGGGWLVAYGNYMANWCLVPGAFQNRLSAFQSVRRLTSSLDHSHHWDSTTAVGRYKANAAQAGAALVL